MAQSRFRDSSNFLPDDFFQVDEKYFKQLRANKDIIADPSYWFDSESPIDTNSQEFDLKTYKVDYDSTLAIEKEILINAVSGWDSQLYNYDDMTICNSSTAASYIILGFLKGRINTLFFETPAYYASIEQAQLLGINVLKIPTYISEDFKISEDFLTSISSMKGKKGIWISQPRYGLGLNQRHKNLELLLSYLQDDDFLIIDEATEQIYPTHLKEFNFKKRKNIIKFRSFLKPLGLNGPRLAFILHHSDYRKLIQCRMEVTQGAIDCFSLNYVTKFLSKKEEFQLLLKVTNNYVKEVRMKAENLTHGTILKVIPIENGYIGSIALLHGKEDNSINLRKELLQHCQRMKCPIILGSAMYFARDPFSEFIRINFFNSEYSIMTGIQLILKFKLISHKYQ
jgi:aspartate/methionine/tyrosine aminotransferase